MITSADEFVSLRTSGKQQDYLRAANEEATAEVWLETIRRFPEMRIWVAHNKRVPLDILTALAADEDIEVREAVAMKNRLSPELFVQLATDRAESVRERIVHNKNTPRTCLELLAKDSCGRISEQARKLLKT